MACATIPASQVLALPPFCRRVHAFASLCHEPAANRSARYAHVCVQTHVLHRNSCRDVQAMPRFVDWLTICLLLAGGDEWLERKGRRSVPGPEQRRGRKSLFETFQMSSNPWLDGRTLDDIFLERKGKRGGLAAATGADMYGILQDQNIQVKAAPTHVPRYYISELVPVDGSLTTRSVPSSTKSAMPA